MPKLCRVDPGRREEILAELTRFVADLKARLPIQRVYLYGSFATGDIHEGSDIDLLIIGDFQERFVDRIGKILDLTELPIEPLVYTPKEFDEMLASNNPFLRTVLATAKEL